MPLPNAHTVKLEVFEGPLDLLLYLIKKEEVDIFNIPIERVAQQYMQYLELMRMLDLNIAGEFLVMAATLMMIKSRMLLPPEDRPDLEPEEADPRWDLVRQLVEYKKFKDAASSLQTLELEQQNVFSRGADDIPVEPAPGLGLEDVSIFDLLSAFNLALKKVVVDEIREIMADRFTVADKIEAILFRIKNEERFPFAALFQGMATRGEIACTFLALLELIKLRQLRAIQETAFGEILLIRAVE